MPPPNGIGINLGVLGAIYPEIPFVDVFKETQPWRIAKKYGTAGAISTGVSEIGDDGWVKSLASDERAVACAFQFKSEHYPAGVYTVLYRGVGTLDAAGATRVVSRSPGRMKILVTPRPGGGGLCIVESTTDPGDPIRDIRVIMPGFESVYEKDPFYPPFINELKPFGTVRMIGWAEVNRSQVSSWADRRPMDYSTQAVSIDKTTKPVTFTGVALEYQIDLANELGSNPWFVTPTMASDDYMRKMAELVHRRLRPDLHPIIEFSNEIWNAAFSDHQYALAEGMRAGLDPEPDPKKSRAEYYWYATRAARMFDIWNVAFGSDDHRIVHVIAGQQGWAAEADAILGYRDTYKKADVLAVAGYARAFSFYRDRDPQTLQAISRTSVTEVLRHLKENIATVLPAQWAANRKIADKYGLGLVVYEGGLDFSTNILSPPYREPITDLMVAAGRDPTIEEIYSGLLNQIPTSKVRLFMHFCDVATPAGWGSYGALEYQQQDPITSPKYVALTKFIDAHPVAREPADPTK
jgi:hypothetical protein